jgi:hypothetical protein
MSPTDSRELAYLLDACLEHVTEDGTSIDACLRTHPQHAAELRPLLELAAALQRLPRPEATQAAFDAGKRRMLEQLRGRGRVPVASGEGTSASA